LQDVQRGLRHLTNRGRMQILTAGEMAEADRRSAEWGVPVSTLMENAGAAVARFVLRHGPAEGLIVALCGKGNNGGDGLVAAAHLARAGRPVRIALLGSAAELKPPVMTVYAQAGATQAEIREVLDEEALRAAMAGAALIVDAVVGTGFKPPLRGLAATARALLRDSSAPVVSVDLPSGWDADSADLAGPRSADGQEEAFRADAVVSFAAPKIAHIFGHLTPGNTFGPVVVADIGTPAGALQTSTDLHWAGTAKAITEQGRGIDGNKGKFGHVLLIGGAFGKSGAPSMMSLAGLRAGAGLVTAAVPRSILLEVARITPELMTTALEEGGDGGLALEALEPEPLAKLLKGIKVVGIGPGLGQEGSTPEFVRRLVERVELPMVMDADALNCLAGHTDVLKRAAASKGAHGRGRTLVLTPHPGEMARLIGGSVKDVEADRIGIARRFATDHGVTLVLKGWRTLIAHPDGRIGVNTTGNPSMAKGGSGDILTGIVSALLAQSPDRVAEAVEAAVFLHGLAGDFACLQQDEHTVLATDTVNHLAQAFRARVTDDDGLTWIAGTALNGAAATPAQGRLR
jgi:hydroxyethylthiazole kinase-like uncharacterized protein yjeF